MKIVETDNIEKAIEDAVGQPSVSSSFFSCQEIYACIAQVPEIIDCFVLDDDDVDDCFVSARNPESFLNTPPGPNPMDYARISQLQTADNRLQQLRIQNPAQHSLRPFNNHQLICFQKTPQDSWKICVPDSMLNELITWFHHVLLHVGSNRLSSSIATHFFHPQLNQRVEDFVRRCATCQQCKRPGRGCGHLAPREALFQPFAEVAVDAIGPWQVRVDNEQLEFKALTMIDAVTNLVEMRRTDAKTGEETARNFEHSWLCRCPRPNRCIHDMGSEFNNHDFQFLLTDWGVEAHPIGVENPQANSICERLHQTVANLISVFVHAHPPQNALEAQLLVDDAIASASHACRCTVHATLGASPGAVVCNRDMLLDVPYVADLITLRNKRQLRIDENLRQENNRRRNYDCAVGDNVYELTKIKNPLFSKIRIQAQGPYPIVRVHTNGTVTVQRTNQVVDRVNIRRLRPAIS